MTEQLEQFIAKLSRKADELNTISDELTASLAAIEKRLSDLHLGVGAEIPLSPDTDTRLAYCKQDGKWGIYIVEIGRIVRIHDADRNSRLLAWRSMGALLDELCVTADSTIADIHEGFK